MSRSRGVVASYFLARTRRQKIGPMLSGAGLWDRLAPTPEPREITFALSNRTGLLSQVDTLPLEEMRRTHDWLVQREPEAHLDQLANEIMLKVGGGELEAEGLSFKDGPLLAALRKSDDCVSTADVPTGNDVAEIQMAVSSLKYQGGQQSSGRRILVVRHLLEHAFDLRKFLSACITIAGKGGFIVFEVPDTSNAFRNCDFSEIWDEHIHYFTQASLLRVLGDFPVEILFVRDYQSDGEVVLVALLRVPESRVRKKMTMLRESDVGLQAARDFLANLPLQRAHIEKWFGFQKIQRVAFFGANHRTSNFIDCFLPLGASVSVVDDDSRKQGLKLSGRGVTIVGRNSLGKNPPDLLIVSLNASRASLVIPSLRNLLPPTTIVVEISETFRWDSVPDGR